MEAIGIKRIIKRSHVMSHLVFRIACYLLLINLSFVFIYPFLHMITTSFKSYSDLHNLAVSWIPTKLMLKNYQLAAETMSLPVTLRNSLLVAGVSTLGHLVACSFIGFGFARFNFPFKRTLFFGVVLSATIPIQAMIIPLYITYSNMGMIDTFLPLIVPTFLGFGLRGGVFIFLFRQYFYGFPASLEEAALIDGCGRFKSFFRIALPSAGPTILVTSVLSAVWHWNDYYEPSLYLSAGAKNSLVTQILPNLYALINTMNIEGGGLEASLLEQASTYHEGVVMAATAIAILPLMIFYAILQKKFIASIERTGLVG